MEKKGTVVVLICLVVILLSTNFVSAFSFGEFFNDLFKSIKDFFTIGEGPGEEGELATIGIKAQNCIDSDGHLSLEESYYVKGYVWDKQSNMYYYDICFFNYLQEQICSNDRPSSTFTTCSKGCNDGACICPNTCVSLGYSCGVQIICGKDTNCGNCSVGYRCVNVSCVREVCTDTCSSLGYQCGTHIICNQSTNCGTCSSGYECVNGRCVAECTDTCQSLGYECGTHVICNQSTNCGSCNYLNGICGYGICNVSNKCQQRFNSSTTICRKSAGECDTVEYCTGTSIVCPVNRFKPSGTTCSIGKCDGNGNCVAVKNCTDSDGHLSLEDSYYVKGYVYDRKTSRYYNDSCFSSYFLTEQICSGDAPSSTTTICLKGCKDGACMGKVICADTCQSLGYECGTHVICNQSTNCGTCSSGYECVNGRCVAECTDTCQSLGYECGNHTICNRTTNCGSCNYLNGICGYGICNVSNKCQQRFNSSTTICRKSAGECDTVEYCTGTSIVCPVNRFKPSGTTCSLGACDGKGSCVECVNDSDCETCQSCDVNNKCENITANDGDNCNDDCTYCASGSCVNRNAHDWTECSQSCYACTNASGAVDNCTPDNYTKGLSCLDPSKYCDAGFCCIDLDNDDICDQLNASITSPQNRDKFSIGNSVTFDSQVSGGYLPHAYLWQYIDIYELPFPQSIFDIGNKQSLTKSDFAVSEYAIFFTVIDNLTNNISYPCKPTFPFSCPPLRIEICPKPTASILSPSDGDAFEQLDEIHFEGSLSACGIPGWNWTSNINGVIASGVLSFNISKLSKGNHNITLGVFDGAGAIATDTITITINEPPSVKVLIISPENDSTFNYGDSITFDSLSTGGTPPYTYSWTSNINGNIGNSQTFNKNDLSTGDHTITLIVTDAIGDTDTKSIEIHILPDYFDWRNVNNSNWMTSVKLQACDDCQIFAQVGVTEAKYNIQENDQDLDIDLSEKYLLNCGLAKLWGPGTPNESCYAYKGSGGCFDSCPSTCNDGSSFELWKISGWGIVSPQTRTNLQYNLIKNGPLYVEMRFAGDSGRTDKDGCTIYECGLSANHAVVLTGYNNSGQYWIIKNSWGALLSDPCLDGFESLDYAKCPLYSSGYVKEVFHP